MLVTQSALSDFKLFIAAHEVENGAKLALIDWLIDEEEEINWRQAKSLAKVKTHYSLSDDDIQFIAENSLSAHNPTELLLLATITQLNQYFAGTRQAFDLPLDTATGTPFQQKVWQALQQIPYGQTISYSELAQNIDQPTAFRAVASANGKNPFSIVIPCHRVIASNGGLGGYTGGRDKKEFLLQIENHNG